MTRLRIFALLLIVGIIGIPASADKGGSAYKAGLRAEKQNNYDTAYQAYKQAYKAKPTDPMYLAAYTRLRFYAAAEHVRMGQALRDSGKLQEALAEFRLAVEIDSTNFSAQQEIRRTVEIMRQQARQKEGATSGKGVPASLGQLAEEAEGPVELQPTSDTPMTLRMTANAGVIYKTVGKLAGVNVLVDSDYKPQKITIDLVDVSFREALAMVALQSKTFWRAVSPNTILVSADSPGKRKEVEQNVMKTFYLHNVASPGELQEAASTLKGILDISRIQLTPEHRAITVRGTPDQMILAEKLLGDIDKPKAEVMIDVAVMQVSRDRLRTLGTNVPTGTSLTVQPTGTSGGSSNQFTLKSLASLGTNNFLVTIPGASFSFLMTDGNTKVLQRPEIRALDDERASLKIGDRVPIATGSFQPGGGGVSPLVNTQFQYLDVGVNIDITPHVHSNHEVTLKMVLEVSSVTGVQNIGGINQPTIGQRRIEHEARLEDGDVNLVGGILEDTETHSLSGYPWLTRIPILKYLFGQETKDRRENEIVFAITPHIIRSNEVTEENLRMVDVGTGSSTTVRRKDPKKKTTSPMPVNVPAKPAESPQAPSGTPTQPEPQ